MPNEIIMKTFGSTSSVTLSPIVTIEPRRRKFHCPIEIKIPLPVGYSHDLAQNLRLLCSITDGTKKAHWEDVTASSTQSLSIVGDCLAFTTTVSARFWIVHCLASRDCLLATKFANEVYSQLIRVPFLARFVVFAKRLDLAAANVRVFCILDDYFASLAAQQNAALTASSKHASSMSLHLSSASERKTLEAQEHYTQVARSCDVQVFDTQQLFVEFGGNLTHSSQQKLDSTIGEQPSFAFNAFEENRLAFTVNLRNTSLEPFGKLVFMAHSLRFLASLNAAQRAFLSRERRRAVCTLGVALPPLAIAFDAMFGSPRDAARLASAQICDSLPVTLADVAHDLKSSMTHSTLQVLASKLGVPADELAFICARESAEPQLVLLMHWFRLSASCAEYRSADLARALFSINRPDIAQRLGFAEMPPVSSSSKKSMSRSVCELLREIDEIPTARSNIDNSTDNMRASKSECGEAFDDENQDPNACYYFGKRHFATNPLRASTSSLTSSNNYQQNRRRSKSNARGAPELRSK